MALVTNPATEDRDTLERGSQNFVFPMLGGKRVYAGTMVAVDSNGLAQPGGPGAFKIAGVAQKQADNRNGVSGAENVAVRRGMFLLANSDGPDRITFADLNSDCYMADDQTVAKTDGGGTRGKAGVIRDLAANGVWVLI